MFNVFEKQTVQNEINNFNNKKDFILYRQFKKTFLRNIVSVGRSIKIVRFLNYLKLLKLNLCKRGVINLQIKIVWNLSKSAEKRKSEKKLKRIKKNLKAILAQNQMIFKNLK